jgi:hypothetical protein
MKIKKEVGASLIELVITVGIFTILMPALLFFLLTLYENFYFITGYDTAILNGQKTLQRMVGEIRQGRQAENGAYAIVDASDQSFTFYANIDSDDDVERVRYSLSGIDIIRGIIEPTGDPPTYIVGSEATTTINSTVRNNATPIFYYYNDNYAGTSTPLTTPVTPSDVRYVEISLYIDDDITTSPTSTIFSSAAQIRGLKNNL